jgi:hypothetical protein
VIDPRTLDDWAQDLIGAITSSLSMSAPKLLVIPSRSKPWWTPQLTEQRKTLSIARRKFRKDPRSEREWSSK